MKFYMFYFGSVFRFIQNYLVYEAFKQKETVRSSVQLFAKDYNIIDAKNSRQNFYRKVNTRDSTTYITQTYGKENICHVVVRNSFNLPIASAFAEYIEDHKETKSKVINSCIYCFLIFYKYSRVL